MSENIKKLIIITLILVSLIFITSIHGIITPFLLAAILAYLVSPFVWQMERKIKFPHLLAVIIVFLLLIGIIIFFSVNITIKVADEQNELIQEFMSIRQAIRSNVYSLPDWAKYLSEQALTLLNSGNLFAPQRLIPYFSGAVSSLAYVFLFIVSLFYFMKDGGKFVYGGISYFLQTSEKSTAIVVDEINDVLNSYLRGQVFLIILMTSVSFIVLTILKVKYAFMIAIFTGIAEIVPLIGPVAATIVATSVALFDGISIFGLPPVSEALVVIAVYFVLRQLEDHIVTPIVIGKATKLHPLLILFLVLVGGHIWGLIGMILAVPFVAVGKVIFSNYRSK
jgi:predicted PurR-regulated permease PerM